MNEGFLSRWSRLKRKSPDGSTPAVLEPDSLTGDAALNPLPDTGLGAVGGQSANADSPVGLVRDPAVPLRPWSGTDPAIAKLAEAHTTLDAKAGRDATEALPAIESLTIDSDFTPFMRTEVTSQSRNAALKKLFADPGFNVMDGLDTYIDDYSKPDPIPMEMLRRMSQSKALHLFDDDPEPGEQQVVLENQVSSEVPGATAGDLTNSEVAGGVTTEVTNGVSHDVTSGTAMAQEPGPRIAEPPIANSPIANSPITNSPITNSPITNSPITNSPIADASIAIPSKRPE